MPQPPTSPSAPHQPVSSLPARAHWRWLGLLLAAMLLVLVFGLYADPALMLRFADQIWGCF